MTIPASREVEAHNTPLPEFEEQSYKNKELLNMFLEVIDTVVNNVQHTER